MKKEIRIPNMGESISQVTIGRIFTPTGSAVRLDEEILEVETDKLNQSLYAPAAGVITFTVHEGDKIGVGEMIGFVEEGQQVSPTKPEPLPEKPHKKEEARRGERLVKMSQVRRVIAERMVRVKQETAMLTTFNEVDMSHVIAVREKHREEFLEKWKVKLGFMSFFVKACTSALRAFPQVNASIEGDSLKFRDYVDISIAVSSDKGLVVPVLHDCDQLTFAQIETKIGDFAARAQSGTLAIEALVGGGFTITNGGVFGSLFSTPLLNPPQCAILGMHKITKRAVVVDDQVVIRPMMYLALSYDHRIIDGKEAVSFLIHVKECIEDPDRLVLEL